MTATTPTTGKTKRQIRRITFSNANRRRLQREWVAASLVSNA
jgi:hypothetical protein